MRSHTKFQLVWAINTAFTRGGAQCAPPLTQMCSWDPLPIRVKCESASRRFQPGEGPIRGLLRDCTTSPINRFAALLLTPATAAAGVTLDPNLWRYKDNVRGTHTRHSPSLTCSPATKGINTLPPALTHNFQPTSYRPETGARKKGRYCNALTVSRMDSLTMQCFCCSCSNGILVSVSDTMGIV